MAESVVSFLLNQLTVWLQQEQQLLGGLKSEVEFIRDEMGHMTAFLRAADAKQDENDPQLKEWVRQVREIAYDTEDVLEKYILFQSAGRGVEGLGGHIKRICSSLKNLKVRRGIALEIKAIMARVENVSKSQQRFPDLYAITDRGSTSNLADNAYYDGRGDALLLEEADVVGIEMPKKQIGEWLGLTDHGLKVISVVGMGGLGKTTLVKKVYDDEKLKMSFHHHVWITVSESFKIENLLGDVIRQLVEEVNQPPPERLEAMNTDGMREFIYKFLQHKNYIVVLDDVWKIDAWEAIRYAFPRSGSRGCGRVVITTRFISIANATSSETNGHTYNMEPLGMEESKLLFYRKAFPGGNQCPPYLEEVAENILGRCKGLPLAIGVIGGLLATKDNKIDEWKMFNQSLGHEMEGDGFKRVTKLLSLSYYDLPYYLKSCFLYLSIFPADHLLEKSRLIRLWIAEGFVKEKQGKTPEEVAEGYLNELVNRSLVQVAEWNFRDGRPKRFHIHDLLQEFIISKAREENIVVIESREESRWPGKIRRLAIHDSLKCPQRINSFKYLRTLLLLGNSDSESGLGLHCVLERSGDMLKVLDLRGAPLETIPKEVFKLYLLKYLSLRDTKVNRVPKSIGNLQNLETLDLKETGVTELPAEIIKLHRLRHILVYKDLLPLFLLLSPDNIPYEVVQGFKAPFRIGCLTSLQELCYIEADRCNDGKKIVGEIGKLTQLRRLGITKVRREDGLELRSSLTMLTKLRSLMISSMEGEVMDLEYTDSTPSWPFIQGLELIGSLEKIPQWVIGLDGLAKLELFGSKLREDPLQYLQDLPNLAVLRLVFAYEDEKLSFNAGGFQRLKVLMLNGLRALRCVRIKKGSMPSLEQFFMINCMSLAELPDGIEHLTKLQTVDFMGMSQKFLASLKVRKSEAFAYMLHVRVYSWVDGQWKHEDV